MTQYETDKTENGTKYACNQLARGLVAYLRDRYASMDAVPAGARSMVNALMAGDDTVVSAAIEMMA